MIVGLFDEKVVNVDVSLVAAGVADWCTCKSAVSAKWSRYPAFYMHRTVYGKRKALSRPVMAISSRTSSDHDIHNVHIELVTEQGPRLCLQLLIIHSYRCCGRVEFLKSHRIVPPSRYFDRIWSLVFLTPIRAWAERVGTFAGMK